MTIRTSITIATKDFQGKYHIQNISLFKIKNNMFTSFENTKIINKHIEFELYCPLCEEYHRYTYKLKDILKKKIIVGGCEKLGIPIFYIGEYNRINKKISIYNNVNEAIYVML